MPSSTIIGTAPDQIPTNGHLGELAFQNKSSVDISDGRAALSNILLNPTYREIAESASKVFIYDTTKDSDGGAWRNRTQNTSWYNEELNTRFRGSKRKFPSVAVIAIMPTQLIIYDGDDESLPMWMIFSQDEAVATAYAVHSMTGAFEGYRDYQSVVMLNGDLLFGCYNAAATNSSYYNWAHRINFITDTGYRYMSISENGGYGRHPGKLQQRIADRHIHQDASGTYIQGYSGVYYDGRYAILGHSVCQDIAMTVLPNAPIDPATGIQVPTIAFGTGVAGTGGGITILRHDGTAIRGGKANDSWRATLVEFDKDGRLWSGESDDWAYGGLQWIAEPPYNSVSSTGVGTNGYPQSTYGYVSSAGTNTNLPRIAGGGFNNIVAAGDVIATSHTYMDEVLGRHGGITLLKEDRSSFDRSMVAYITNVYNTGWQLGRVAGAWMSDTATDTIVSDNLVTNGTFDSNVSGWTVVGSSTIALSSNRMQVNRVGGSGPAVYQAISTIPGRRYAVSAQINSSGSRGDLFILDGIPGTGSVVITGTGVSGETRQVHIQFTATVTTHYIMFAVDSAGTTIFVDNVTAYAADLDRSFRIAPMQIRGTINKSRCEPDADLVCYSGLSDSNFLHQPYFDAFDVGTGDFSVYGWFRLDRGTSGAKALFSHGTEGQNNGFLIALDLNAGCYDCGYLGGTFIASSSTTAVGTPYPRDWAFITATRNAGTLRLYVNGREVARGVDSVNWTTLWTQPGTRLGARVNGTSGASDISMALWRASPIGMGAKHVERIYNDERKLFAPGAKCTLYGTSATITTTVNATPAALAYDPDTNLLHAGTSSGRTAFNGLVRAEFSTTPIGGALSASNGLVVEE